MTWTRNDRGQASLMAMALMAIVLVCAVAVARVGVRLGEHAKARAAADAAALAGVIGGQRRAAEMASANGATLVSFVREGDEVVVMVSLSGIAATARATNGP